MASSERLGLPTLLLLFLVSCTALQGSADAASHDQCCVPRQQQTWPHRILPGMPQFPPAEEFQTLASRLNGSYIPPSNPTGLANAPLMYNLRKMATPAYFFNVASVKDVQEIIVFAKQRNLWVAVRSSGHSYIGRSTHEGGIIINLGSMKGRTFNLNSSRSPAGEVTVETGNSWMEVYTAVDKQTTYDDAGELQRRVIVGGSAHTVAMGGYTQGGGHAPICRQLGLAVDSLLEATLVLADGRKAVVNEQGTTLTDLNGTTTFTNDTSLFWAIRGGGGGTWGVVTTFTFKLHFAPQRFRNIVVSWALNYKGTDIGSETLKFVTRQLGQLSEDWGGYMLVSGDKLSEDATGSLTLFLNHFGSNDSTSNSEIDAILDHNIYKHQYVKVDRTFNTFLEYEVHAQDPLLVYVYLFNTFIQQDIVNNDTMVERLAAFLMSLKDAPDGSGYACTGAMVGGKMRDLAGEDTPVNPSFRSALMSMSCALAWDPSHTIHKDDFYIGHALQMSYQLAPLGQGVYFNEPAEDLCDWKEQFWGDASNYERLLRAKEKWDPDGFFWCRNCVGSDRYQTNDTAHACPVCPEAEEKPCVYDGGDGGDEGDGDGDGDGNDGDDDDGSDGNDGDDGDPSAASNNSVISVVTVGLFLVALLLLK